MLLLSSMLILLSLVQMQVHSQPLDNVLPVQAEDSEVGRTLYDQRQTGKYNIHVSIKDVAIIEVDQNELADDSYTAEDDDYYYDDSALTIKPIKFTTEGSSTTKIATTTTTSTPIAQQSTVVVPATPLATVAAAAAATPSTTVAAAATTSSNISAYSAQLLADIAATQHQKPKTNNLIIMDSPMSSSSTLLPKWLHARSKDEPITTTTTTTTAVPAVLRPVLPDNVEYTPAQGHDSPIFKVKVQRAASADPAEPSRHCRTHQYRDALGKCRTKRSGSILRKLFSMLVSLPFAGNRRAHGHGLQVSP